MSICDNISPASQEGNEAPTKSVDQDIPKDTSKDSGDHHVSEKTTGLRRKRKVKVTATKVSPPDKEVDTPTPNGIIVNGVSNNLNCCSETPTVVENTLHSSSEAIYMG